MKSTIYYFSGTGNSLKVAKDIKEKLEDAELIRICKDNIYTKKIIADKIGIVFPVYFWGMPALVKEFVEKIEIPENAYVFTIVTFGGAAGASIDQLEKILNRKNIKLSAAFKIKMPGNYQIAYPPIPEDKQKKYFNNEEEKIAEIIKVITNNDKVKFEGVGEGLMTAAGNMVSKSFKPYEKDSNFWTDEKCNGCGTCSRVCPANNIKMNDGKPEWQHKCEQCVACLQWCPQKSIQYKKVTVKRGRYHHPDIKVNELSRL